MGGTTAGHSLPYPTGADRVSEGDNAIQGLAEKVDTELAKIDNRARFVAAMKARYVADVFTVPGVAAGGSSGPKTVTFPANSGFTAPPVVDPGDLALVVGVVALGPWGLVLVVAIVRGYNLTIRLSRRSVPGMDETRKPDPAVVVPAVIPGEVVEPDPAPKVDEDKLAEAVERADVTAEPDERRGTRRATSRDE
jgi:hypothetical protein